MALEIRKKAHKNFEHVYNTWKLTFSDLRIAFNGETQNVLITRENGAFVIKRDGFNVTEISVYDETGAGTEETFVNVTVLANRLIDLGYIAFYEDGDIVPSEFISSDASNALVIGTDGLLFVPPAGAATNGLPVGGTTGQILKKQSGTDFDADWEVETGGAVDFVSNVETDTILGRITAGTGNSEELTPTQVRTLINVEDGAEVNDVDSVNGQTGAVVLDEHDIVGTRISESVATTKNIDLDTVSDFHYTMTADTAFTFTNTPTGNEVKRCKIRLTGEFAPSWTQAGLNSFGDAYDGTKWNDVLVEMWLDGTIKGLLIFQQRETA